MNTEIIMKKIIGINHIGIRVSDLNDAKSFYEQLGYKLIIGPIGSEPVAIMKHPSGIVINLVLNMDINLNKNMLMDFNENYPDSSHMALDVSSLKTIQDTIESLNIQITEGPVTLPDGSQMFFIRDQNLNVIEFHQNA